MRHIIFAALLLISFIQPRARVTLDFPGENSAYVGILVKDIRSGEVIATNDDEKAMIPASVMKSITAATAASTLPEDFTFKTRIYLTDKVSGGVCKGNLVIESCADPTIDSEMYTDKTGICDEILQSLVKLGVRTIKGKIIVNENLSDYGCIPEWEIDDVAWAYGAGLHGFNYKDNKFTLWPVTGRMEPYVPNMKVKVEKSQSNDLLRGIFSDEIYAFTPNPNNKKWSVNTTMSKPAEVFKSDLGDLLSKNGIAVNNTKIDSRNEVTPVCTHLSPSLDAILREMMVSSHNMFAEAMLRSISPGSSRSAAIKKELAIWKDRGMNTSYMHVCDGSGLSRADRLKPRFIADVLEWMALSQYASRYIEYFPKVGTEGTVKNFLKDTRLARRLALKTGSMNAVQSYAGYMLDDDGAPTHVVVIIVNSFYCDRASLRRSIEQFLLNTF